MTARSSSCMNVSTAVMPSEEKQDAAKNFQTSSAFRSSSSKKQDQDYRSNSLDGVSATVGNTSQLEVMTIPRQTIVLIGLLLADLLMALDGTMIVTAIPVITKEFKSINDIGWYGSIYFLALVIAQPIFGSLFKQFNAMWTFYFALLVFEVGSIISASAQHSYVLIIGRAIAGAGGAGLFAGALLLANLMASDAMKPVYAGIISSMFGLGSAAGPLIGGAFTDSRVTWRFCFWLNLPIGALIVATVLFYKSPGPKRQQSLLSSFKMLKRLDLPGLALLSTSLVCLLLALHWGGTTYPWSSGRETGLLVGFAVALILFLAKQRFFSRDNDNRTVTACVLCDLFFVMAVQGQLYYLPIYFQALKSNSPLLSGVHLIAYLGAMTVSPVFSGILVAKSRYFQPSLWLGVALFVVGSGLLYTINGATPMRFIIGAEILLGFGAGMQLQAVITAIQAAVGLADLALGTSLHVFMVSLGPTIGISVAEDLFIKYLGKSLAEQGIDPTPFIAGGGVSTPQTLAGGSPKVLDAIYSGYEAGLTRVFLFTLIVGCVAFLTTLFVKLGRLSKQN